MRYKIINEISGKTREFSEFGDFSFCLSICLYGVDKRVTSVDEDGFAIVFKISFVK